MQPSPFIGVIPREADCRVPEGAKVFELKACENCVVTFLRERKPLRTVTIKNEDYGVRRTRNYVCDEQEFQVVLIETGERFCPHCRSRLLMPPPVEEENVYRDQLPRLGAHYGNKLLRYDNSIVDTRCMRPQDNRWHTDWKDRLISAFVNLGPQSLESIVKIVGARVKSSRSYNEIMSRVRNGLSPLEIKIVASEWPRRSCMGPARKLFFPVNETEYFDL